MQTWKGKQSPGIHRQALQADPYIISMIFHPLPFVVLFQQTFSKGDWDEVQLSGGHCKQLEVRTSPGLLWQLQAIRPYQEQTISRSLDDRKTIRALPLPDSSCLINNQRLDETRQSHNSHVCLQMFICQVGQHWSSLYIQAKEVWAPSAAIP